MTKIITDVATLSTIPEKTLEKLLQKVIYSISEAIQEDILQEKSMSELDLGLGILYVKYDDKTNIKYKFIPSDDLISVVSDTVSNKTNLLEDTLNTSLAKKFMNIYKELC